MMIFFHRIGQIRLLSIYQASYDLTQEEDNTSHQRPVISQCASSPLKQGGEEQEMKEAISIQPRPTKPWHRADYKWEVSRRHGGPAGTGPSVTHRHVVINSLCGHQSEDLTTSTADGDSAGQQEATPGVPAPHRELTATQKIPGRFVSPKKLECSTDNDAFRVRKDGDNKNERRAKIAWLSVSDI
ncbi:hypothetical protein CRENBAI_000366 [Crenichthys baileyi]|uniref:Uncharacterized protein n=1 Tax=Crenichthys baileyi TaxID=28760 RepID=A0AAV9SFK0_9TELE